jgi:NADH:ubiquinone oxidoreductase subunit 2 (subunit N)
VLSYASLFTVELFEPKQKPEAAALLAIGAIGAIVLATAANLLELALGVETLSISGAVLVAIGAGQRPLEAAFKYFVLTAVTFATLLFGMSIIFVGTGSPKAASPRTSSSSAAWRSSAWASRSSSPSCPCTSARSTRTPRARPPSSASCKSRASSAR